MKGAIVTLAFAAMCLCLAQAMLTSKKEQVAEQSAVRTVDCPLQDFDWCERVVTPNRFLCRLGCIRRKCTNLCNEICADLGCKIVECEEEPEEACSGEQESLCDDAYEEMTGKNDNRAKCCPPTSGCSKTINAGATAVCSTDCGTNCLGTFDVQNPSGTYNIAFCEFADSGLGLPECAALAGV